MRSVFRGLSLALPLLLIHVACSSDDNGGSSGGVIPTPEAGTGDDTGVIDPNHPDTGSTTPEAAPPPVVNDTNETIDVDGNTRSYVLSVPVHYDASKKYPLVLSFHGDGGNGQSERTSFPFEKGSVEEAIIAYPTGENATWNLYGAPETNPDYAFIKQLVPAIAAKYNVDTAKVLGFGYSNGAFFVNQLACKVPDLFKAIASHEGGAPADDANGSGRNCTGGPTAVFVFHGTADFTVDVGSGSYDAKFWAQKNGCSSADVSTYSAIEPSPCKAAPGCPAGKPVTWCLIEGLNHYVWDRGAEVSWKYFTALP